MTRKSKPKPDDPEQSRRFVKIARQWPEGDKESFDRAFREVATAPRTPREPKTRRRK
jgi:hypothetical protein